MRAVIRINGMTHIAPTNCPPTWRRPTSSSASCSRRCATQGRSQREAPAPARATLATDLRPQVGEARPQPALALRSRDPRDGRGRPRGHRRTHPELHPKTTAPAAEAAPTQEARSRPQAAAQAPAPQAARSTTSPPNSFPVPTAAPFASASARRSASSSNMSRPA